MNANTLSIRLVALSILGVLSLSPYATIQAQQTTVTYVLDNVWMAPDVTHPSAAPRQMTGVFRWTFTPGDFENGNGELLEIDIPWFGSSIGIPGGAAANIDKDTIELTLIGNFHSLGLDVTMCMSPPMSANAATGIDLANSEFEIEVGITRKGHFVSGNIVPVHGMNFTVASSCQTGNVQFLVGGATAGQPVAFLAAIGMASVVIPPGVICAGERIGLDPATLVLAAIVNANANGVASLAFSVPAPICGLVYFQALDLVGCQVSDVVLM